MRLLVLITVLTCFAYCDSQADVNLDLAIDEVFGLNRTQIQTQTTRTRPRQNGGTGVGNHVDQQCRCVHHTRCNGTININGKGIIDIRLRDRCSHYLQICCKPDDIIQDVTPAPLQDLSPPKSCGQRNPEGVGFRITGDDDNEAQFGEFPWMVAILYRKQLPTRNIKVYQCGGTLIHPSVVLTAAHCVLNKDKRFEIRAGEWDAQTVSEVLPHQDRVVREIVRHESFYSGGLYNDIALLFLRDPVTIHDHIDVICLPPLDMSFDRSKCFASGWGKNNYTKESSYQMILKKIELPVINRERCQKSYRRTRLGQIFQLHKSFICAGGESGIDTCKGDGGGPLVCPIAGQDDLYMLAGIVSWGIECGTDNLPGVYVNVPLFRVWIDEQMKLKGLDISGYTFKT